MALYGTPQVPTVMPQVYVVVPTNTSSLSPPAATVVSHQMIHHQQPQQQQQQQQQKQQQQQLPVVLAAASVVPSAVPLSQASYASAVVVELPHAVPVTAAASSVDTLAAAAAAECGSAPRLYTGTVKSFRASNGFGFIKSAQLWKQFHKDVFVHRKDCRGLRAGDKVEFGLLLEDGGPRAVNIKCLSREIVRRRSRNKDADDDEPPRLLCAGVQHSAGVHNHESDDQLSEILDLIANQEETGERPGD
eukprot:TRINITY_DN5800_c4_g1_i1.p1 TRINITY_DN5800_c4_g1~~TRINITY_DN5800_c4_g1_i1.p1  ORF type:complete len:275 (+),score=64.30 TRINITY_DN5800_c4_g1_i1:87-827(+)